MSNYTIRVIDSYVYRKQDNDIYFLVLKRAKTKIYEHLWQSVAGKIKKGEKAWETAVREVKEETGSSISKLFVADHISQFYEAHKDRVNIVPVFGAETLDKRIILSSEHSEYKWLKFDQAIELLSWNGQKKGLISVYEMIIKNDDRMKWSIININD